MLVQTLRLQRGWTQEQLATVSGLGVRTIQRIEKGHPASNESLKSLAAAFDIDFQILKEPAMSLATESLAPNASARVEEMLAFEHVRAIKRYWFHLLAYGVVVPALIAINVLSAPSFAWSAIPALVWGLALLLKGLRLFARWPWGPAWERRQVEKVLGRPL